MSVEVYLVQKQINENVNFEKQIVQVFSPSLYYQSGICSKSGLNLSRLSADHGTLCCLIVDIGKYYVNKISTIIILPSIYIVLRSILFREVKFSPIGQFLLFTKY